MDIAAHYFRSEGEATSVREAVEAFGRACVLLQADLGSPEASVSVVDRAAKELGRLDVLVNNAGVYERASLEEVGPAEWERTIAVNLTAPYLTARAAVPHMRQQGGGRIINVSSQIAFTGTDHGAHYAAAKAGIIGLTRSLARELARDNITVNAVAPGAIETAILAGDTPDRRARRVREIPLGRVGTPEEIAAVVAFLAGDDASWMTGATVHANGGQITV